MSLFPVLYIPHGGGPMPLLGDPSHQSLTHWLRGAAASLPEPKAILVVSAHWEEPRPTVQAAARPGMLFDYYGFPPESYRYRYAAPGAPELAQRIRGLLSQHGIATGVDEERGYDHGVFVPLMLLYPQARIPVLQLSLIQGLDAAQHLALGAALSALREEGVLILGSGMSFHNMRALMRGNHPAALPRELQQASTAFNDWLVETCTSEALTPKERHDRLQQWAAAPGGRFSHPREEHLLPLLVCAGAAGEGRAETPYNEELMGHKVAAFLWQ